MEQEMRSDALSTLSDTEHSVSDNSEEEQGEEEKRNNIFVGFPRKKRSFVIITRSDPIRIIDKTLDLNDVDPSLNRLSMPFNNLIGNDFLNHEELRIFEENNGKSVEVFLLDQTAHRSNMGLKKLVQGTTSSKRRRYWSYELSGEWNDVVKANGLKNGDKISLWSFRCRGNRILYFSLVHPLSFRSSNFRRLSV